jgi:beta-glucosidase
MRRATCTTGWAIAAVAAMALWPARSAQASDLQSWLAAQIPSRDSDAARATEQRVGELLDRMTLEQKVGQMIQAEIKSVTPADVRAFHLGSILNGGGSFPGGRLEATVDDWRALADQYRAASLDVQAGQVAIPVIWGTDAVHGHNNVRGAVLFPHNIGLGAAGDEWLVESIGAAVASEVRSTGIDWVFAPTVAVVDDLRWGRAYEGFGADPALVGRLGAALVRGLQGAPGASDALGPGRVIATAKHFIGDGATAGGVDQGDARISESELRERHAAGYYAALAADVQTVMVSFSSWRGQKMHGHRYLLTEVLKGRLGFDGVVVSDWNGVGQVPGCTNSDCPQAINAGIDMIMAPEDWKALHANIIRQVKDGVIPQSRIDDAVRRILRVKLRAGVFNGEPPSRSNGRLRPSTVGIAAHRDLARRAVRQSMVLLKNDNGRLPLRGPQRILVTGSAADSIPRQSGGWSLTWQGTDTRNEHFPGATSIHAGIAAAARAAGGSATLSVDGAYDVRPDVAIVVFGEEPYAEGRGDVRDLHWSQRSPDDLALIRRLKADGIPVVAVLVTGRPLWTSPEINAADAFVVAWLPGTEGGGVADLLIAPPGDAAPARDFTGRLPFAWPARAVPDADGVLPAAFPVGFGLSYATSTTASPLEESSGVDTRIRGSGARIFERGPVAPWRLFVGDPQGWQLPVGPGTTASPGGWLRVVRADHLVQEDALRAVWSGKGQAQVYLQAGGSADWTELVEKPQQLAFSLKVDARPTAPVFLRQDCVFPCGAKAEITRLLKTVPTRQWVRVSMDLRCMVDAGLDPRRVDTPFLITTAGRLDLTFSHVALEPIGATPPTISCSK